MKKFQKKLGNKGFSLVELIVVIAIMAVLVGVLAPTLIKNVEKSRESKDRQNLDTVTGAITTVLSDDAHYDALTSNEVYIAKDGTITLKNANDTALKELTDTIGKTKVTFSSKVFKNFIKDNSDKITITISDKGTVKAPSTLTGEQTETTTKAE